MCNGFIYSAIESEDEAAKRRSRRRFLMRSAFAGAAALAGPLLLPSQAAQAGGLFPMPSVDDQKKAGKQAEKDVLKQYKLVDDSRTRELKAVGSKLVNALHEPDRSQWNYDFHLVDSKDINAFALPGGPLFFFTGLFDSFTTEDELAGVVGHEMTHVRLQHWAKAYQKQQERDTVIGLGLSLFHIGGVGQTIAGFADQAISLKYSRGEEAQADQGGLQDMVDAGYNPQGMVDMFGVLLNKAGNGSGLGGDFLSNHPLTTDRIKAAKSQIAAFRDQQRFPQERPMNSAVNLG